ncbi:Glycosyltransferase [Bacillus thuringiensis serovar berliner ATCC 10792]|nr:Glycosyltransferase [Bacillus thuringiensis serovar berliner ATCC 10792]
MVTTDIFLFNVLTDVNIVAVLSGLLLSALIITISSPIFTATQSIN